MKADIASIALPAVLGLNVPPLIESGLKRLLGIDGLIALYGNIRDTALPSALLRELQINVQSDPERLPAAGPVVVVANHPFGLLDGAVLAALCMAVRPDVRVLANDVLSAVPELSGLVIPVDVLSRRGAARNVAAVRQAIRHVAGGGLLIVFPAGEVERCSGELKWSPLVARLIAAVDRASAGVRVVPAFVHGRNSTFFRVAGSLFPPLGTALLPRELLNKRGATVRVDFGKPVATQRLLEIPSDEERIEYLRWRMQLLGRDHRFKPRTRARVFLRKRKPTVPSDICVPVAASEMEAEILRLPEASRLASNGDLHACVASADQIPYTLREIGRLREITFRAVGEGTGRPIDLDGFDRYYLHLFVWNAAAREIVGAYRIGRVPEIRQQRGPAGLYTATLFSFGGAFLDELGPALELGRSFVRPEYQRTFAPLLLLWKGIGRYVAANPQHKVLFGPVSISSSYSLLSRELMVAFLERRSFVDRMARLVRSRNPFRTRHTTLPDTVELDDLSDAIADIDEGPAGVPILLRQYLKLGGKLVGFNVDPEFSDALDGLIVVDLTKTEPKLVARYLGDAEARAFLDYHRGENGSDQIDRPSELGAADHCRRDSAADTLLQVQRRAGVGVHLLHAWRRALGQDR